MREKKHLFGKDYKHIADQYKASLEAEGWIVTLTEDKKGNWTLNAVASPTVGRKKK